MWIKRNAPPRVSPRVKIRGTKEYAGVVELADTYDLGSYVVRHAGSSPVARTKTKRQFSTAALFFYTNIGSTFSI